MEPYVPDSLPLTNLDFGLLVGLVGEANAELARYDGMLSSVVNPSILLSPITTQEAVLSSKIEGTQATLDEVLEHDAGQDYDEEKTRDIKEIMNYRLVLLYAQETLNNRPLSLSMLREMHAILMDSVRGQTKSPGEFRNDQNWIGPDGCRFTDDTVCTVAVADCLMNKGDFADYLGRYTLRHHTRGFGGMFMRWAKQWEREPYDSWGNGSAMRVSSVAHFARDESEVLELAKASSAVTHSHPDGIAGAQATALAMWMAKEGVDSTAIRKEITGRFDYDLTQSVDDIREWYTFDVSCAGSVPQAITCALEATDYEDAIRNAVSIGGDTDTIACIAGGIAETMFGLPDEIAATARTYLTDDLRTVVDGFGDRVRSFREPN